MSAPRAAAPIELPLAAPPLPASGRQASAVSRAEWLRLAHRAKVLSWMSLGYMTLEGAVAITAGVLAGSVALIGFGIDSGIEGFASLVIVWRFTGHRLLSEHAEERAQRLVAIQFFLLAPIPHSSIGTLWFLPIQNVLQPASRRTVATVAFSRGMWPL